jgi:hypothetical protein
MYQMIEELSIETHKNLFIFENLSKILMLFLVFPNALLFLSLRD